VSTTSTHGGETRFVTPATGVPVVLISHNMPQVFEIADRVHVMRLGRRVATITPQSHTMADAVSLMTGATSFKTDG
jgi:fructose transport system ATP-binding protein